ncbi:MAG: MGH1-like glycoside hydrolase domain-containing protein [Sulfuricaulis sp.]
MNTDKRKMDAERRRLEQQYAGKENWRHWGPYLAERAWGTVREDYSPHGTAWEYFDHDQARSRAYRWNEDGLGGICDDRQQLCFALALWNGRDPILKERAFGLTGNQGVHGEDVKEVYFYLDATPSHSFLRYLYKYPQGEYPYRWLVEEAARRTRLGPDVDLFQAGLFKENRYWDVEVQYAKAGPEEIHVRIVAANRGPDAADLHLLPTLWFRNTWSWGDPTAKPILHALEKTGDAGWAVRAEHSTLGNYYLYGRESAELLFTENETNNERLWGVSGATSYVKDAFHRRVIQSELAAVNPAREGTKFSAWHVYKVAAGQSVQLDLVLSATALDKPFARNSAVLAARQSEADIFYNGLLPAAVPEDHRILRQALAGMIWSKQFFHYDVQRWLQGDLIPPPAERERGRNHQWKHFKAADILSMPDCWEYPWFAAWDLAYHCAALALVDVDFAKEQLELVLRENYLHPNGQIPAYEWAFGDVNPPIHAMAALKVFRAERVQRGQGDFGFLRRILHKLLLNYAWWLNRKDSDGQNVFEGGFMGLDNISVYDRSQALPPGYELKQADTTGWMAMFALNMAVIALELTTEDPAYEDIAIQCYTQFLAIAQTIGGNTSGSPSLWDPEDMFFKDLIECPDGSIQRVNVFSLVGLIPLFACEVIDQRILTHAPRFRELLREYKGGVFQGHNICACPDWENERGEHLLSLVDHTMLPPIIKRLLNEEEFLAPHGIRSLSKIHATHRNLGVLPGVGQAMIDYEPGESTSGLFGGNSNWRGPVWVAVNYTLIQSLEKFHRFLGDAYKVPVPCVDHKEMTLQEISRLIAERVGGVFRRNEAGNIPAFAPDSPFQHDPHWTELLQFHEYFHAETGQGLGAAHQTGWTGLAANLVIRRYRRDIPEFWRRQRAGPERPAVAATGKQHDKTDQAAGEKTATTGGFAGIEGKG